MRGVCARFVLLAWASTLWGAQTKHETFDSAGVKIHYATAGEGEAVVLIHGWMGDSTMWGRGADGNTELDAASAPGFKFIAIDCRGHGKSDKPHDVERYGAQMAEDVVRLLDHLHIRKAHLVGYSMGAFICAKVAVMHPDRVLSVICGGQAPLVSEVHPAGSKEVDAFAKAVADGKGLGPYILAVTPPDRPRPTLEQANALGALMVLGKDPVALAAAGKGFVGLEVTKKQWMNCQAPVLFVYGSKESSSARAAIEAVRGRTMHNEVRVIEGGDHITTPAKPAFGAALIAFLNAHRHRSE